MYNKLNHFDNYVGSVIKHLKSFFRYLVEERNLNIGEYYKRVHIPREDIEIVVLSPQQLNKLIYDKVIENKLDTSCQIMKDIFVFGCTVALRYSDLISLEKANIYYNDGNAYLRVKSMKTNTFTSIKLPQYAIDIVRKYEGCSLTKIFPYVSNPHFNKKIKLLAEHIFDDTIHVKTREKNGVKQVILNPKTGRNYKLSGHITTHTMRRTAITTMLRLGMPEHLVKKISGHSPSSKDFYKYIAYVDSFVHEHTDKYFENLTKLNSGNKKSKNFQNIKK